jgi:hypothetical protein
MARFAHRDLHIALAFGANGLFTDLEFAIAVLREMARAACGIKLFNEKVLNIRAWVGESPGNAIISAENYEGDTWQCRTDHILSNNCNMGEVPYRRRSQSQVRVVRKQGFSSLAARPRNDPVI